MTNLFLVEESVDDEIPALGVIEEDKEGPVDEPGLLLKGLQRRAEGRLVDEGLEPLELPEGRLPVLGQDLARQLAPHPVQVVLVCRLNQDSVDVEELGRVLKWKTSQQNG